MDTHREYSNLREILLIIDEYGFSSDMSNILEMKSTLLDLD